MDVSLATDRLSRGESAAGGGDGIGDPCSTMSKAFLRTVGDELSAAAAAAKNDIKSDKAELAKIFTSDDDGPGSAPEGGGLVTRTKADDVLIAAPASGTAGSVLLSGPLKKRDGTIVKKWVDVHVELRENSLTCFSSADKTQILDTLVIDAGIEIQIKERDKLPALILRKAPGRGPAMMAKELVLGAESEGQRDRWAEILDACCLKARTHVEARKMVQEEAASRARAEAELQRKALEDAARTRRMQQAHEGADSSAATFALGDLDDAAAGSPPPAAGAEAQPPATPTLPKPMLQPVTPAEPPDGRKGGRMSMGSRMRSAFAFKGKDGKEEAKDQRRDEEPEQLEESMNDMMLAEANRQLRQLQEDLRLEREGADALRKNIRQLTSEDKGAQEMMVQVEHAREEARRADELVKQAREAERAAQAELASLRAAAAATAAKRAEEAAARDLELSHEAEDVEAMRRQVASLQEEVVRLQEEVVQRARTPPAAVQPRGGGGQAGGVPASIMEFCEGVGLGKYAELMEENEIDLDVLVHLEQADWEDLGIEAEDLPQLMQAVEDFVQRAPGASASPVIAKKTLGAEGGTLDAGASQALKEKGAELDGRASAVAEREAGVEEREIAVSQREAEVVNREREASMREAAVHELKGEVDEKAGAVEEAQLRAKEAHAAAQASHEVALEKERAAEEQAKKLKEWELDLRGLEDAVREREAAVEEAQRRLETDTQQLHAERSQTEREIEVAKREVEETKREVEEAKRAVAGRENVVESRIASMAQGEEAARTDLSAKMQRVEEERAALASQLAAAIAELERVRADAELQDRAAAAALDAQKRVAATALEDLRSLHKEATAHTTAQLGELQEHVVALSALAAAAAAQEQRAPAAAAAAQDAQREDVCAMGKGGETGAAAALDTTRRAVAAVEALRAQVRDVIGWLRQGGCVKGARECERWRTGGECACCVFACMRACMHACVHACVNA